MTSPVLYLFHVSPFAEKARWALDVKRVPYRAVTLLPGPHRLTVRRYSRSPLVPLLVHDGAVVQGSSAIIDHVERIWPEPPLTPQEGDAAQLERSLDREVGEEGRRVFYSYLLDRPDVTRPLFSAGGPSWGPLFYRVSFRVVAAYIRWAYQVDRASVARARQTVAGAVDRLADRLRGRAYLFGDRLSRLDITAGAVLAPLFGPPEHACRWDAVRAAVPGWREWTATFETSPVAGWVRRLYREHRVV